MAEADDAIEADALPHVEPTRPGARRPRWPVALLLVWAALAVAGIAVFHASINRNPSRTNQAVAGGAPTQGNAQATAPVRAPTKARTPAPMAQILAPVSASALGPAGSGAGDNPQAASMAIDASTTTAWTTDWYRTAQFGGLQAGTGLLIDMGHPVTITSVRIILGSARGADLQVRSGKAPVRTKMRLRATASDAYGMVHLNLARPQRARYVLIWFTRLAPDSAGTFKVSVYNVRLKGNS